MEKNKTRGYLPEEIVLNILKIYKAQQKKHNELLNEIEFISYLSKHHMDVTCDSCKNNFIKCDDNKFICFLLKVLKYNKKNIAVSDILFPSFSDIYENITDTIAHDLLWHERFQCKKCKYLLCHKCRIDAEYPLRFIDIDTTENDNGSVVCPVCKNMTMLNEYVKILREQRGLPPVYFH
jgi:hypothetical protein